MAADAVTVEVEGCPVRLTNLDKVLYPQTGTTKALVVEYYTTVAPALLPRLADRPLTLVRYPDGVERSSFFAKNAPAGTPDWVRTVNLPAPGSGKDRETIDYVVADRLATVVWAANLAGLEMHVPQWTVGPRGGVQDPDLLVFDLDPGAPADVVDCARVALLLRDRLADDGLTAFPKTSGSKGLQLYVPVRGATAERTSSYAKAIGQELTKAHGDLVLWQMAKDKRPGKVFVDWSQNSAAKTTIAAWSLRARPRPTVSTPVSWDELDAAQSADDLTFTMDDALARLAADGDPLADLHRRSRPLPADNPTEAP